MRMLTMILVTENTPEIAPSGDDNEEAAAASPRTPKISKKGNAAAATPKVTPGGKKRKLEEFPPGSPPPAAAKRPSLETPDHEKISRSGRVIKPNHKWADDGGGPVAGAPGGVTVKEEVSPGGGRKMWVKVKMTGDKIEINLDKNRPEKFDTEEDKIKCVAIFLKWGPPL